MRQVSVKSRKQRRLEAKQQGVAFKPKYAFGISPINNVNYTKFDDKFTKVSDKVGATE